MLMAPSKAWGARHLPLCRTDIPDWARQPQHDSGIPGWINVVVALAAIIPILYLLLRDTKVKAFLKPTEFQELPLEHKEVRIIFKIISITDSL